MSKKERIKKLERDVDDLYRKLTAINGRVMDLECRIDECAPKLPRVDGDMLEAGLRSSLMGNPQDRTFYR